MAKTVLLQISVDNPRPKSIDLFTFGKYRNQSIEEILDLDPDYIVWAYEKVAGHAGIDRAVYTTACASLDDLDPGDHDPNDYPEEPRCWGDL